MSEIGFRAWDKDDKKMLYRDASAILRLAEAYPKWIVPLQYTGLQDKDGKKVYVGDIIKENPDGYDVYGFVFLNNGSFQVNYRSFGCYHLYDRLRYNTTVQVVGNTFATPELLQPPQRAKMKGLSRQVETRVRQCERCKGLGLIAQDMMHGGICGKCKGTGKRKIKKRASA